MTTTNAVSRRGSPLALIAIVLGAWIGSRAMLWENPFPLSPADILGAHRMIAADDQSGRHAPNIYNGPRQAALSFRNLSTLGDGPLVSASRARSPRLIATAAGFQGDGWAGHAFGHQMLWMRASSAKHATQNPAAAGMDQSQRIRGVTPVSPPFEPEARRDRWSVDAWAFWRQGSNAAQISQGRVPIYGASQIGANLQYRAAPNSVHDPRIFLRAYQALVSGGETEVAGGVSARPVGAIPVRIAAEVRATKNDFGTEIRPAAFAVTELPPQRLPARFRLEAYGGAGYVGGDQATAFADGQIAITRKLAQFQRPAIDTATLSVGGGAWGGAQEGASRIDVGPTVRLDLSIGEVPARIALDWRERIGGDAAPDSGIAATLSTRF